MKRYIRLFLIVFSALSASCTFEEANIFPESAAIRLENAQKEYNDILCAASNGWVMEYFPTDTTKGVTLLMKFNSSKSVMIAAKSALTSNVYTKDSSLFEIITDNGPVLTFNTYNKVFHIYSNPQDPAGGSYLNGIGLGGDYEFIVLSADENQVKLKGKKRGTYIYLNRLADNQLWPDYFTKIEAMNTTIFDNAPNNLYLVSGLDTVVAYFGSTQKFQIAKFNEDPIVNGETHSFIVTPTGIRFHTPYIFNEKSLQTFTLSDNLQQLKCTDPDNTAYFTGPMPGNFYATDNTKTWNFVFTKPMGTKFNLVYNRILASCQSVLKEKFTNMYLKYYGLRNSYTLSFKSGKYTGYYDFKRTNLGENKVKFEYMGTADANGNYYKNSIDGFNDLILYMGQSFTVSSDNALNLNVIKFSAVADPDISFYLSL